MNCIYRLGNDTQYPECVAPTSNAVRDITQVTAQIRRHSFSDRETVIKSCRLSFLALHSFGSPSDKIQLNACIELFSPGFSCAVPIAFDPNHLP